MVTLFFLSGGSALLFLAGSFITGWFSARLRKRLRPQTVIRLHRSLGVAALVSGLILGLLYWRYLR